MDKIESAEGARQFINKGLDHIISEYRKQCDLNCSLVSKNCKLIGINQKLWEDKAAMMAELSALKEKNNV